MYHGSRCHDRDASTWINEIKERNRRHLFWSTNQGGNTPHTFVGLSSSGCRKAMVKLFAPNGRTSGAEFILQVRWLVIWVNGERLPINVIGGLMSLLLMTAKQLNTLVYLQCKSKTYPVKNYRVQLISISFRILGNFSTDTCVNLQEQWWCHSAVFLPRITLEQIIRVNQTFWPFRY